MFKLNGMSLIGTVISLTLVACGGGSSPETATNTNVCTTGQVKSQNKLADGTIEYNCYPPTDTATSTDTGTNTSTVTTTDTGTNTGTNTATGTNTGTASKTSTFVYTDACDYINTTTVTGGDAVAQAGALKITGSGESWNLCITYTEPSNISVKGYAFKTAELGQANPPSLVTYTGVMGAKCISLFPVSSTSDGPTVQGNAMTLTSDSSAYVISDGVITATMSFADQLPSNCPYRIPGT